MDWVIDTRRESPKLASQAPIVNRVMVYIIFRELNLIKMTGIASLMDKVKISRIKRETSKCLRFKLRDRRA